MKANMIICK